ncbi:hypothetical protein NDU88_001682 [Pleurodeles waltl]|uniref:Uncharacterized protein n=1 Tax=Pleurodeles waltl TaxID=8319 RepID=A0AAV7LDI3_PLEWA|nr:hypothetical protein NDU88_001682 [Pleurodeles waltl]
MMFTLGCIGAKGNYLLRSPGMAPTEPRQYSRIRSGPHGGHLRFSVAQQEVDSRQGARASHRSSGLPHSGRDLLVPGPRTRRGSAASHPHPRPQSRHGARADGSSRLSLFGAGAARAGADSVQATTLTARLGQHRRRTGPHFAPSGSRQDASRCTGLPPQRSCGLVGGRSPLPSNEGSYNHVPRGAHLFEDLAGWPGAGIRCPATKEATTASCEGRAFLKILWAGRGRSPLPSNEGSYNRVLRGARLFEEPVGWSGAGVRCPAMKEAK